MKYMPLLFPLGLLLSAILGYTVRYRYRKLEAAEAATAAPLAPAAAVEAQPEQQAQPA